MTLLSGTFLEDSEERAQKVVSATAALAETSSRVEEIKSYYWWEGKVNFDPEWRVVVVTTSPFEKVQETISKVHSYDLPMIIYDAEMPAENLDLQSGSFLVYPKIIHY